MDHNRRQHQRHEISLPVLVKLKCSLRDVSLSGAKLEFDTPSALPDEFLLCIGPEIERWCRVAWRSEREVGLTFIPNPVTRYLKPELPDHGKAQADLSDDCEPALDADCGT